MPTLRDIETWEVDFSDESDAVIDIADALTDAYGMPPDQAYLYALSMMVGHAARRTMWGNPEN